MNFVSMFRKKEESKISKHNKVPASIMNQLIDFLGLSEVSGVSLSEATYFACMKVLCEAIGKLPLKLLKYNNNNGVVTARDHPLYTILKERPNPYMTSTSFWSTVEFNRNHYGNAYVLITGAGRKTQLWILPSDKIEIVYDDACLLRDNPDIYYVYQVGRKHIRFLVRKSYISRLLIRWMA